MTAARPLLVVLLALFTMGCDEEITVNIPPAPSPIVTFSTIEFRVLGNAQTVRIRHANSVDGLSQVTTVLPYVIAFKTDRASMFLSLDVTPLSYPFDIFAPFLSAQIFVDGALFREGSSSDFALTTLSVTGTWRK